MTIEEKAKAYDRVAKEVKDFFEGRQKMYSDVEQTLEYLFPELAESEDERIRKRIIALVNAHGQGMYKDDMLAWLEKQGEKPKPSIRERYKRIANSEWFKKTHEGMSVSDDDKWELVEKKPSWSEEDETKLKSACALIKNTSLNGNEGIVESTIDWLKSLKERIGG